MARSRNHKTRSEDKKRGPESGSKLASDIKIVEADNWSITSIFKPEDLQEISSALEVTRLDDSHLLLGAVALSRFDIVKQLLHKKLPINSFQDGTTPLILAVKLKLIEMADFLVRKGADLCQSDAEGNNALLLAAQHADWDQESFLDFWNRIKEINVDINHANKVGHSILHCLVRRKWTAAIDSVINQAASLDINNMTSKGVTALMMASSKHRDEIIKSLLSSNADLLLEDQRGCTALCYAIAYFIQKRVDAPSESMEQLMEVLRSESSSYTYLHRRLELLEFPPEENFATTLSTVIVNVITFTVHCLDAGLQMLLHLNMYKRIKSAAEKHLHDQQYLLGILDILTELSRHYNCCYSYRTRDALLAEFVEAGMPNLCLLILNNQKSSPTLKAMLPIILTSSHGEMKGWLQENFTSVSEYYKSCSYGHLPPLNFYPDKAHCRMVEKACGEFKVLMNRLERGERIVDEPRNYLPKGDAVAAKPFERITFYGKTELNQGGNSRRSSRGKLRRDHELPIPLRLAHTQSISGNYCALTPSVLPTALSRQNNSQRRISQPIDVGEGEGNQIPSTEPRESNRPHDKDVFGNGDTVGSSKNEVKSRACEKPLDDLTKRLCNYLSKCKNKWQSEFEEGYPEAVGDVNDYLQLMEKLPAIEAGYINLVMISWTNLVEKLTTKASPADLVSTLANLEVFLECLEEDEVFVKNSSQLSSLNCHQQSNDNDLDEQPVFDMPLHLMNEPWA